MTDGLNVSRRIRRTPYTGRVEAHGVRGFSVTNHMLLPKAFQPVYIAMHCSTCSSRQVYRKCSENSSCGQNYVENGPLFNHFDFGDTLLCAEALLTSTLSLLPPQSAAYANRCQQVATGGDAAKIAAFQCFALAPAVCLLMQVSC